MLTFVGITAAASCYAGAWTMPQCEMYGRLAFNYYTADESFNDDGDRIDFTENGTFTDMNAVAYVEYGLLPDLTLIGNIVYKHLEYEDDALISKSYGVGDVELGARRLLFAPEGGALSIQGLLKIPDAYDEDEDLPLGNGQYDAEVRLLYGMSLYPAIPGYINVEAGYRFRFEAPADEFRYLLEAGMDFSKKWYGRVKLDGILGIGNEDRDKDFFGNPTATEDYDLGKLDICIGYKLTDQYGIEFGVTPSIYGKNTAVGTTWTLAATMRF
jgi:protein XagA